MPSNHDNQPLKLNSPVEKKSRTEQTFSGDKTEKDYKWTIQQQTRAKLLRFWVSSPSLQCRPMGESILHSTSILSFLGMQALYCLSNLSP